MALLRGSDELTAPCESPVGWGFVGDINDHLTGELGLLEFTVVLVEFLLPL